MNTWNLLSKPAEAVKDAASQCHHAAQLVGLAGRHLVEQRPDDSNTNMQWSPELEMFVGNALPNGLHVALCPADLSVAILDSEHHVLEMIELHQHTFAAAFSWLREKLTAHGVDTAKLTTDLHYEMPPHPVADGAAFDASDAEAFAEIGYLYDNGYQAVRFIDGLLEDTVDIAIWPHHFDIGSFAMLAKDEEGAMLNTLGFGLAPSDDAVGEYYFYITTWDKNGPVDYSEVPELPVGSWNSNQWNGAVLLQSDLLKAGTAEAQLAMVLEFARFAIQASIKAMRILQVS